MSGLKFSTTTGVLLFIICMISTHAKDVFFAGGQSNATAVWANSIQTELTNSNKFNDPLVIQVYHPGSDLAGWWYNGVPNESYKSDFFNNYSTGLLQSSLEKLITSGENYNFKGFFWFQGESDTSASALNYQDAFLSMLKQLQSDLGLDTKINFTLAIIDANQNSIYDNPNNLGGITRQGIENLRSVLTNLGSLPQGSYVDTRGYDRSDAWHLYDSGRQIVGQNMAKTFIETFEVPEPTAIVIIASVFCVSLLIRQTPHVKRKTAHAE